MEITKERLGIKAKGRRVTAQNSSYELREPAVPSSTHISFGISRGKRLHKDTSYQIMIRICGFFLIGFGGWFLLSAREYLNRCFPGHIV
ncbi:MAG: hypothetical protein L6406_00220 [Desulfobacterales bacterium]|nr:hypothetical protein [Desulfobacterales bacterium]